MAVIVLIAGLSICMAFLLSQASAMTLCAALIFACAPFLLNRPHLYFFAFLVVRPVLDLAADLRGAGGTNAASIATIFLAVVCAALVLRRQAFDTIKNSPFLRRFNLLYGLFLLTATASILACPDKAASLSDFIRLVTVGIVFNYSSAYFSGTRRLTAVLWCIVCSCFVPLAFGAYQFFTQRGLSELGFNRIYGTFIHPAVFSQFLIGVFFIGIYLMETCRAGSRQKYLLGVVLVAVCAALAATFARTSWIAFGLGFLLYAFLRTSGGRKSHYLLIALFILALFLPLVSARFSDIHTSPGAGMSSWQWRLEQWKSTADTVWESPLIGHGMGMYERRFTFMAHNDYLRIAYEVGLLGLGCYLALLVYVFLYGLRGAVQARDAALRSRYKVGAALLFVIMVISLADNLVRSTMILLYFLICIGACFGPQRLRPE